MSLLDINAYWLASRAAGTTAIVLASLSVTVGLLCSKGVPRLRRFEPKSVHEALSLATLAMVAVHGLVLLGDPWLKPGLSGIAIPFTLGYQPFWTGIGVIAAYGLVLLGLSYYARGLIGPGRWRSMHRFTALFWLLGVGHALGAGTDAGQPWFRVLLAVAVGPPLLMLALKLFRGPAVQLPSRNANMPPIAPR